MSKTDDNLKAAFEGESLARKEGYHYIAKIFEETAENEKYHAMEEYRLLHGESGTLENLKVAIGIKLAAGNIEADLAAALHAGPDFITLDGRAGATGAAPKFVKAAASVPTIFALYRARKYLDAHQAEDVSLIITGGLRVSSDFAKALALGATAIAIGTSALMAIGCQQYKICNTGRCPMGIATQDPALRAMLNVEKSARRLENYLRVCTDELKAFARLTGNSDVHGLAFADLCTTNSEISNFTEIEHV